MDQQMIKFLGAQEAEQFKRFESLFAHPGWKDVMAWAAAERASQHDRLTYATTWEANRVAYGAMLAFARLETLQETTEQLFAQSALQAQLDQQTAEEDQYE
jgi:hypothetical protein